MDQYSRQVLNVALRVLGDATAAQDVHQEVFLAIWRRWHRFNGQVNWNAYLYRTTVRKALEHARQARALPFVSEQPERPDGGPRPDGPLRTAELQQKLAQCLAKLPKRQADVFVLSRMEGYSHEQIAELLGCSRKTVSVHLHRAVKRLARQLREYLE